VSNGKTIRDRHFAIDLTIRDRHFAIDLRNDKGQTLNDKEGTIRDRHFAIDLDHFAIDLNSAPVVG